MTEAARLIFPALRWHARTGFAHEQPRIEATLKLGVGGYILFGGTAKGARELSARLKSASRHPILIGSDFERGGGQQFDGLTHLPPPAALGFLDDPAIARRCGEITAREARSVGINWVYAPVADLDVEPENPIVQTRSFGDDPGRVGRLVSAWVSGAEHEGVVASAKHFPGHGRTRTDSHDSLPEVPASLPELASADLLPFGAAIAAGVHSIMTAHVAYPSWDASGLPATLSTSILAYLRRELGFRGVVVTDALIMEGALRGRGEALASVDAIRAGCDALLYPRNATLVAGALEKAAQRDAVVESRLKEALEAVRRLAESSQGETGAPDLADHQAFAAATADLAIHTLRGDSLALRAPLAMPVVDDDLGGPYAVGPRDLCAKALAKSGIQVGAGGSRVLLVFSEPRSWKGHARLSKASLAAIERELPRTDMVLLFGHPRLTAQIPGEMPVVCAWHGQPLMQEAAARWVSHRLR